MSGHREGDDQEFRLRAEGHPDDSPNNSVDDAAYHEQITTTVKDAHNIADTKYSIFLVMKIAVKSKDRRDSIERDQSSRSGTDLQVWCVAVVWSCVVVCGGAWWVVLEVVWWCVWCY